MKSFITSGQIIPIVLLSSVTGSEPKPVYWLIFYFPVFHVLTVKFYLDLHMN